MYYPKIEEQKNNKYLTKGLTFILALAAGVSVANLYYNQPLLIEIAKAFQITSREAGFLSTLTQLGYAAGVFLFVPLGDIKEKRKLILTLIALVTVSLLGVATAQNLSWLYFCCFAVGLTTGIPQIIIPLAAQLADPKERGKVIGTIVSAALIGVLSARTVAGYIGYLAGWRFVFVFAAILMGILGIVLYFKLPVTKSYENLTYKELIKSLLSITQKYSALRKASITGAMMFGAFSVFWTTLTFLLESPTYNMNVNQVGLFGLFGVVGALGARIIGRLNDKKDSKIIIIICIITCIIAYIILSFFSFNVFGIILGVIILDFGIQGSQVSNQTIIYSLSGDDERSRINTVFIVSNFIGGAIGSSLGSLAWSLYNWSGVCVVGSAMILIAFVVNLFGIRQKN
ncbi:MFS transporter [Clostridium estertheticum]|uniref:MFS transporter n=1 Tax=Clostridium estertheticum TaxID=238834 RepID=UPI00227D0D31|nr:MFS transporter [Clostridium estertheticum]WAG67966.1 MFS transporter [Clostridium estertheticum]